MSVHPARDRSIEVRRRMLDAAAELIPQLGWNAVSTRNLAERAGVTPGLVHYHFASLPALLREAALDRMRGVLAQSTSVVGQTTPVDGLDLMLAQLDVYTGQDPMSLLFTETYLAATRDEELRSALSTLLDGFLDSTSAWLAAHGKPAPRETAAVLAAAIDGLLLHRALNPDLTAAAIAPVLRRLLTITGDETEEGER